MLGFHAWAFVVRKLHDKQTTYDAHTLLNAKTKDILLQILWEISHNETVMLVVTSLHDIGYLVLVGKQMLLQGQNCCH